MRILIVLLFIFAAQAANAQKTYHWPQTELSDSGDSVFLGGNHNVFYSNTDRPFYTWDKKPRDFEFMLFNRWGDVVAETNDPDFIIDDVVKDIKHLEQVVYIARISFTGVGGVKRTYIIQYNYMGFYCSG